MSVQIQYIRMSDLIYISNIYLRENGIKFLNSKPSKNIDGNFKFPKNK